MPGQFLAKWKHTDRLLITKRHYDRKYVTGFAKRARTDIPIMAWHESHTIALSRHTNERATNSQVWHYFCDPVNSWQSTMECVVPLGHTNKATLGVKLLPVTVSAWQVNCGCLCTSMDTQWLLFQSNVWKNLPSTPHPFHPPTPYKLNLWYWRGLDKGVWKSSSIS